MDYRQSAVEAVISASAPKAMYGGSVGAFGASFFLSNEFLGVAGLLIGVAGFLVNMYYKDREDERSQHYKELDNQRLQEEHDARMAKLNNSPAKRLRRNGAK